MKRHPAVSRALLALPLVALTLPAWSAAAVASPADHAGTPAAAPAAAPAAPADPDVLATDLLTPQTVAAGDDGSLWFSQNSRGALELLPSGQAAVKVYQSRGGLEVGGVSVGDGRTWFTVSGRAETYGRLMSITEGGEAKQVADIGGFEAAKNPDGEKHYGFRHLGASCAAKFPGKKTPSYTGKVQTHPYATLRMGGKTYIADAAANAILKVKDNGRVRTVAVLPSVATTMTKAYARKSNLPGCTIGEKYRAESVPTDVVAGPGNSLYVTTLPGGPAAEGGDPDRGAVWKVGVKKGKVHKIADGLTTPTGMTVTPNGDIYVAELFADQIVRIPAGTHHATPFASEPFPGDVVSTPGGLVATVNVLSGTSGKAGDPPNADIVRFD